MSALLILALSGPSAASLLCEWTCAAKHQQTPATSSGCHDRGTPASTSTTAAAHTCHELAAPEASILTAVPHVDLVALVADELPADALAAAATRTVAPSPSTSHAPPNIRVPLRI